MNQHILNNDHSPRFKALKFAIKTGILLTGIIITGAYADQQRDDVVQSFAVSPQTNFSLSQLVVDTDGSFQHNMAVLQEQNNIQSIQCTTTQPKCLVTTNMLLLVESPLAGHVNMKWTKDTPAQLAIDVTDKHHLPTIGDNFKQLISTVNS